MTYLRYICVVVLLIAIAGHRYCTEFFVEKKQYIIVTLTTSPRRIAHIRPTIDSILRQDIKPDKIMVNLPHVFKRNNTRFSAIPAFLTENPTVQINWCEDLGPATKLLGALPAVSDPDAVLIAVDDDIGFTPDFITKFQRYIRTYPEAALTGSPLRTGIPMRTQTFFAPSRDPALPVVSAEFVEGYTGIVVRRKFMDDFDYDAIVEAPSSCYRGDDFVFSNHLRKKNIPILAVPDVLDTIRVLDTGLHSDALHLGADGQSDGHDYEDCARYFRHKQQLYLTQFAPCTPQCRYQIEPISRI
jgi:hypothetical protein